MDALLFLSIMIAVGWVVIWCCVDHSKPSRAWWPFDMREHQGGAEPEAKPQSRATIVETRPWRRSPR